MEWSAIARQTVAEAAKTVPEGATFKERRAIISAAYPFGPREMWPYKAWCKAVRDYLRPFDPKTPAPPALFADYPRDPITGRPVIL